MQRVTGNRLLFGKHRHVEGALTVVGWQFVHAHGDGAQQVWAGVVRECARLPWTGRAAGCRLDASRGAAWRGPAFERNGGGCRDLPLGAGPVGCKLAANMSATTKQVSLPHAAPGETVCGLSPTDAGGNAHLEAPFSGRDGPFAGPARLPGSTPPALCLPPVLSSHQFHIPPQPGL